jgi:hypothetical protein
MPDYPEHMRAYRANWSGINRRLSEDYVRRERHRVSDAIDALTDAEHVTLAMAQRTRPASTPGKRDGLPRSAQAATAALDRWFAFQFQGSRSATLLAG